MIKKTVLLTEMFNDVCTPSEKRKFDSMYAVNNKGAATAFALRTIKCYWDLHIAKKDKPTSTLCDTGERMIRINGNGRSWLQRF